MDRSALVYKVTTQLLPHRAMIADIIDLAGISSTRRVLDLCCGTGALAQELERRDIRCSMVGLDYAPAMLAQARRNAGTICYYREIDLAQDEWGIPGQFDVIVCANGFNFLPNPTQVLVHATRLLRPNGVIVEATTRAGGSLEAVWHEHLRLAEASGNPPAAEQARFGAALQQVADYSRQAAAVVSFPTESDIRRRYADAQLTIDLFGTTYADQDFLVRAYKA